MKRHVAHHGEARRFEADDLQYYANIARLTAAESLRDPDKLHLAAQDSIAYAGISLIARRDSATVVPAWELACRMSVAVFEAALYQDHLPASIELSGGQFVTVTSRVSPHLVHAIDWVHAYALALSCRDQRALNVLCQVSAALLRESPTECDEFVFSLVEALRALHQGRHDVALALLETVLKTDPSSFHVAPAWAFDVALPFVDIVRRFILKEHDAFDHALAGALELHRTYYEKVPEWGFDPRSYVATLTLGVACLAVDHGFPIEVDSAYIPDLILRPIADAPFTT